jgi:hypothetical protein
MRPMRGIAAMALVVSLAAGCSGDSTSATPTQSPSDVESESARSATQPPTPPATPLAATARGTTGAVAVVRYYVDLVNHAAATGDVVQLRALGSGCRDYQELADELAAIYANGGSVSPVPLWRVRDIQPMAGAEVVSAAIHEPATSRIPSAGGSPVRTRGGDFILQFVLHRDVNGWTIMRVTRV